MLNKKSTTRIFLSCSFIALVPVFLWGLAVWSWMWSSVGLRHGETCTRSFQAVSKGIFWDRGEWHHYVDFAVDVVDPVNYHWRVAQAPMPSAVYRRYIEEYTLRVTYSWPSNWLDPFSIDDWQVCLVNWKLCPPNKRIVLILLPSHHDRHRPRLHQLTEVFVHLFGGEGIVIIDPPGH